jgi:hypothetical protein
MVKKRKNCQYSTCNIWLILKAQPILANTVPCSLIKYFAKTKMSHEEGDKT